MVLQDMIGVSGPTYEMVVETGKIREFARAIRSKNPEYQHREHAVAPPTFLTVAGSHWGYTLEQPGETSFKDLGIDVNLLLHAEEEYEYYGPPPIAGDRLLVQSTIRDAYAKTGHRGGRMIFYVIETTFRGLDGSPVATQRTRVVETQS